MKEGQGERILGQCEFKGGPLHELISYLQPFALIQIVNAHWLGSSRGWIYREL